MTPPAIRVQNLRKSFAGRPAVHDLSFEVRQGEIFGLLGHNGAGKSTTFGMLLGMVAPDGGDAFIGSHSVRTERGAALAKVGAIFETPCFYDYLSGWDNLAFLVSLSGAKPADSRLREVAANAGLQDRIHDKVRTYSHGMRQRLGLAQALLPGQEVLLLDEPTDGLDPQGIQEMRATIRDLRDRKGMTVLLSSHLLAEVEQLCDRVAILHQGRLLFCGEWRRSTSRWRITGEPDGAVRSRLEQSGLVPVGDAWEAPEDFHPGETVAALVAAGIRVTSVQSVTRTLEDFYLETIRS
ncbi:MAG: ABC transporter ATP-binding protein [Chthoniobacterales bacterium]|nr:ABC transporter ATP-binding protein [Chthoniobacterales bacterium]